MVNNSLYLTLDICMLNKKRLSFAKRKESKMGAIIVSIFVSAIAWIGGIYFYIQDHKPTGNKQETL